MPRSCPAEFRRKVLDLVEAGRPVAEVAEQLGVTGQTIYNWRNRGWAQKTTSRSALSGEPSHRRSRQHSDCAKTAQLLTIVAVPGGP